MSQIIELREIPRGKLEESLETATRQLHPDPGAGHRGSCDMFRGTDGFPICRGQCGGNHQCHLVIIGFEGSHSDLCNYLVFCTCMTDDELDKLIGGRAERIPLPQKPGNGEKQPHKK